MLEAVNEFNEAVNRKYKTHKALMNTIYKANDIAEQNKYNWRFEVVRDHDNVLHIEFEVHEQSKYKASFDDVIKRMAYSDLKEELDESAINALFTYFEPYLGVGTDT